MLCLLICAACLLHSVHAESSSSSLKIDDDAQQYLVKLDYVNDRLSYLHQQRFRIFWSYDLQQMAEEHRDRLASLEPALEFDFFVQLRSGQWLLSMSRNPVVIRMFADEYIVRKETIIRYLLDFNFLEVGTVGCALYHEGRVGKIFCIYGFSG